MNFGQALELLKVGRRVCREGWNGKGMWLELVSSWEVGGGIKLTFPSLPFIAMKTADDKMVPWLASQTDILAEDWRIP